MTKPTDLATVVALVERNVGSSMSSCVGNALYRHPLRKGEDYAHVGHGIDPEHVLGRRLGPGSIVEVTIHVLKEEPMPTECINPWGGHAGRQALAKDAWVGRHCIGHPEHEAGS